MKSQRILTFIAIISFIGFIFGEHTFDWETQIAAIRSFVALGDLKEAEDSGKVLLESMGSENVVLLELLGGITFKRNKLRQAADYYLNASKFAGSEAEQCRFLILAADAYYQGRDYALAGAIYRDCYEKEKNDEILFRYGCALLHSGNIVDAEKLQFRSERLQAKFDWNCAVYWNKIGNLESSVSRLLFWVERGIPEGKFYNFCAQMQYRLKNFDDALQVIYFGKNLAGGVDPRSVRDLELLKLRIDYRFENFRGIAKEPDIMALIDGKRELKKLLLWKCFAVMESGDFEYFATIINDLRRVDEGLAGYLKGQVYLDRGDFEKSLECFHAAGKRDGRVGYLARYRESQVEFSLGNFKKAGAMIGELLEEFPKQEWIKNGAEVRKFLEQYAARVRLACE